MLQAKKQGLLTCVLWGRVFTLLLVVCQVALNPKQTLTAQNFHGGATVPQL